MVLICPICENKLIKQEKIMTCSRHHFDLAKEGYVNLLGPHQHNHGDNKEMVQARTRFLNQGFYQPLLEKLVETIHDLSLDTNALIVDAGCGEGYYTKHMYDRKHQQMYGIDMSKQALKYAAKHDRQIQYILASMFHMPIKDHSISLILNIFAPFAEQEFRRILNEQGYVIRVIPGTKHLFEMKEILYEQPYENEITKYDQELYCAKSEDVMFDMQLLQQDIINLVKMTPYFYKTKKERIEELMEQTSLHVKAHFIIQIYKVNK